VKNSEKQPFLIGIDEVGRGPIAGPVAVGAFVFLTPDAKKLLRGVRESKQLSEEKREEWYAKILEIQKAGHVDFHVSFQSEKTIDNKGLSFALKKCLETSLYKLNIKPEKCFVLLDGGLKAPSEYFYQKTIIRGDAKEPVIALASICAKVLRDRKMKKWGKKYPHYGFEVHKGYGTKSHYEAVKKYGLMALHRYSFCRILAKNGKVG
jgi:ribonuclease HII